MTENALTNNELEFIRDCGLPAKALPRYVRFRSDRSVQLTARGYALYRAALLLHGLDPTPVDEPLDLDGLLDITEAVRRVRLTAEVGVQAWQVDPDDAQRTMDSLRVMTPKQMRERLTVLEHAHSSEGKVIAVDFRHRRKVA